MDIQKNIKIFLILCFVFFIFKIIAIYNSQLGLHGDEAQYWVWSRDLSSGYFSKPPLLMFLIRFCDIFFGSSVFGIKMVSLFTYVFSTIVVFFLGKKIFNIEVGLLSAITFFLMPGVSFSSFIVSTDVPLLFFWSLGLYVIYIQIKTPGVFLAILLGLVIGLGFLSKYAMVYFFICTFVYFFIDKNFNLHVKKNIKLYFLSLVVFLIIIYPNISWNINNGWLTLAHTLDNASLNKSNLNPSGLGSFLIAQVFIVGPVFSICIIYFVKKVFVFSNKNLFLISYSLPILVIVATESLLVRAHGNWAAVSFVGLVLLFVSFFSEKGKNVLVLNNFFNLLLGIVFYGLIFLNLNIKVFDQLRGYEKFSHYVLKEMKNNKIENIVIQERMVFSLVAYHLKDYKYSLYSPKNMGLNIDHHFQLKNGLSKNIDKDFIYIGNLENLDYLNNPYKIMLLKKLDINNIMKDVAVYSYNYN